MRSTIGSALRLALASLIGILGLWASGAAQAQALTATLTTDRGCGAGAVYTMGERNTFFFSVSQNATITLTLLRPDGTSSVLFANQPLAGGVTYFVRGIIGNPPGQRVLTLNAVSGSQTAQAQCTYSAQAAASGLTVSLQTNKGCGAGAVFNLGEPITFSFSVSQTALVTLQLIRPDGTSSTFLASQQIPGGVTEQIQGIIGNPLGQRRLILDAVAGSQTAHMECDYTAQGATTPLTATLTTNRGCGAGAVFNLGDPTTFTYSVSQTALVTLQLIRPDGTTTTFLANQPVPGGVPQTIPGAIGNPLGQRRLILDAVAGSQTAHVECDYTAVQGSPGGSVTLSLNIDQGCGGSYHLGQLITVTYSATASTTLTLVDQHADGSVVPIFSNQPVVAGQTYSLTGIIGGTTGGRTLVLSAPAGTPANPATCQFNVVP